MVCREYAEHVEVDATGLYFDSGKDLKSLPLEGGTPSVLATIAGNARLHFALDDSFAYYTDPAGSVGKVPKSGGAVITLASGQNAPGAIAVDSAAVFWANTNTLNRLALTGGTPSTIGSGLDETSALVSDGAFVYAATGSWTMSSKLLKIPVSGGASEILGEIATHVSSIQVHGSTLFAACNSTHGVDTSGSNGAIVAVPIAGGSMSVLATSQADPRAVTADDAHVYWTNWGTVVPSGVDAMNGALMRVSASSGDPETLLALDRAVGIAIDATHVYWSQICSTSEDCARISKLPK